MSEPTMWGNVAIRSWRLNIGRKVKARISKVVFSEVIPVPLPWTARQVELRGLNAWMRQ